MVERFHRHLKSALRARLEGPNWVDALLWVLLGIRTATKEDLGMSYAELVYGEPLVVPGKFIPHSNTTSVPTNFLQQPREKVQTLVAAATSQMAFLLH